MKADEPDPLQRQTEDENRRPGIGSTCQVGVGPGPSSLFFILHPSSFILDFLPAGGFELGQVGEGPIKLRLEMADS